MSIPLTGSGSLFVRLGHLFGSTLDILSLRGAAINTTRVTSSAKLNTRLNATISPDYANGTAIQQLLDAVPGALAGYQTTLASFPSQTLLTLAKNTLQAMWGIDQLAMPSTAPLSQFQTVDLTKALTGLIAQMVSSSDSLQGATVSAGAQTAVGTPTGTPIIVVSTKNGKGATLQLLFPETITFACTSDSQTGSATAGNEPFTASGQTAAPDVWSHLYPAGSGIAYSLSAVDGSKYLGSTGNLLNNSGFGTYTTANYPDNWVIDAGAAGTTVFNGGTGYDANLTSVKFTGDGGGTNIAIRQPFSTTPSTAAAVGGSNSVLTPNTVYHLNGWIKCSAMPSAGVLTFRLVDGDGTVIADDAGTSNSFTKSLTAVSTSWVNVNGSFRTPAVLPTTTPPVALKMYLSTAIDSAKSVFLSRFSLAQALPLYAGGPFASIHSGATRVIVNDSWTVAIANAYATTGSGLMHLMLDRYFGLRALGLQFPVDASPSVADSLIA